MAHVPLFRLAPKLLVPDNLKSGVNKASFYDPEINRTYGTMAAHFSVGILPARPGKPRNRPTAAGSADGCIIGAWRAGRLRPQLPSTIVWPAGNSQRPRFN